MCAFAVDDGFVIPIHRRSPKVADNSGRLSLVPKAIHQPSVGVQVEEASPHWSVLKEIYEEIFSGKPAERFPEVRKHDWFLNRSKQVNLIWKDKEDCGVLATGFAIDALKGSCHISFLVYVEDTEYWKKYSIVEPMWEQEGKFQWLDSRDADRIAHYVASPDWTSDGLFSFVEGILLLKDKFPKKVNLPEGLKRVLAS